MPAKTMRRVASNAPLMKRAKEMAKANPVVCPPATSRKLNLAITLRHGDKRCVTAALGNGDQLELSVEGVDWTVRLPIAPLFWEALRTQGKRHGLLPRTLKQAKPMKPKRVPDKVFAVRYGVSRGRITAWRKQGAPLSDPDRMGDYIFNATSKPKTRVIQ